MKRYSIIAGLLFISLTSCQTEHWTQLRKSSRDSICIVREWTYIERSYGHVTMDYCEKLRDKLNMEAEHRIYSCWVGNRFSWQKNRPVIYCE